MSSAIFIVDIELFKQKSLIWAQKFEEIAYLDSSGCKDEYSAIDSILAVEAASTFESYQNNTFERLQEFRTKHPNQWMFGFLTYDLKNEIEDLTSSQPNRLNFPSAAFFIPNVLISYSDKKVEIQAANPQYIFKQISSTVIESNHTTHSHVEIKKRMSKSQYSEAFKRLHKHIKRGDIYEVNLCQEFYAEEVEICPLSTYNALQKLSPTPFSAFFKWKDKFVLSASPERFLAKRSDELISQPIKGTARRGITKQEDQLLIEQLRNNPKEIAENIMIVDLVRNDLTLSAQPGTVDASKRLQVRSFEQVHQLVSTITCKKAPNVEDVEAIKNTFPPGSMTGAPKVRAMQLCDQYENSLRGLYSGTVGYFAASGDFDFNVVIRSILYNRESKYLSFHTGGAITLDAKLEDEYQECLLKASAILQVLNSDICEPNTSKV